MAHKRDPYADAFRPSEQVLQEIENLTRDERIDHIKNIISHLRDAGSRNTRKFEEHKYELGKKYAPRLLKNEITKESGVVDENIKVDKYEFDDLRVLIQKLEAVISGENPVLSEKITGLQRAQAGLAKEQAKLKSDPTRDKKALRDTTRQLSTVTKEIANLTQQKEKLKADIVNINKNLWEKGERRQGLEKELELRGRDGLLADRIEDYKERLGEEKLWQKTSSERSNNADKSPPGKTEQQSGVGTKTKDDAKEKPKEKPKDKNDKSDNDKSGGGGSGGKGRLIQRVRGLFHRKQGGGQGTPGDKGGSRLGRLLEWGGQGTGALAGYAGLGGGALLGAAAAALSGNAVFAQAVERAMAALARLRQAGERLAGGFAQRLAPAVTAGSAPLGQLSTDVAALNQHLPAAAVVVGGLAGAFRMLWPLVPQVLAAVVSFKTALKGVTKGSLVTVVPALVQKLYEKLGPQLVNPIKEMLLKIVRWLKLDKLLGINLDAIAGPANEDAPAKAGVPQPGAALAGARDQYRARAPETGVDLARAQAPSGSSPDPVLWEAEVQISFDTPPVPHPSAAHVSPTGSSIVGRGLMNTGH